MDKKSKTLIIVFTLMITTSIVYSYYKYIIKEDINFYIDGDAFSAALAEYEEEDLSTENEESDETLDTIETLEPNTDTNFGTEVISDIAE